MTKSILCQCGCGGLAPIATKTNTRWGYKKGEPVRFISGHNTRTYRGEKSPGWKGGRYIDADGYIWLRKPGYPNNMNGYIMEHRFVLEQYLGRLLERSETHYYDEIPHHIDGNKQNNTIENLELCLHGVHTSFHMLKTWERRKMKVTKNPKSKGNQFERDIARRLSLWWSNLQNDDIFWRTDSSGGRSTQRAKKGLYTQNATGDIASRCVDGDIFIKNFVVEVKRGYNKLDPLILLDKPSNKKHLFIDWWSKLDTECIRDNAAWPMLIFKRDRSEVLVAISEFFFETILKYYGYTPSTSWIILHFKDMQLPDAVIMNFEQFLSWLPGPVLKEYLKTNEDHNPS